MTVGAGRRSREMGPVAVNRACDLRVAWWPAARGTSHDDEGAGVGCVGTRDAARMGHDPARATSLSSF